MPWAGGGGGGQDISQRPRVHGGIHIYRGQPQPRATGGQILAPACSESSSSLKWGYEAAHFRCSVSSFCLLLPGAASGGAGGQSAGWLWWGLYWEACDVRFSDLLSWLDGSLLFQGLLAPRAGEMIKLSSSSMPLVASNWVFLTCRILSITLLVCDMCVIVQ